MQIMQCIRVANSVMDQTLRPVEARPEGPRMRTGVLRERAAYSLLTS